MSVVTERIEILTVQQKVLGQRFDHAMARSNAAHDRGDVRDAAWFALVAEGVMVMIRRNSHELARLTHRPVGDILS